MAYVLILFPLAMAGLVFAVPSPVWRPRLLLAAALGHLILVLGAVFYLAEPVSALEDWLLLDALGKLILGFQSVLFFLCCAVHAGLPGSAARSPQSDFLRELVGGVGHDDAGVAVAPASG